MRVLILPAPPTVSSIFRSNAAPWPPLSRVVNHRVWTVLVAHPVATVSVICDVRRMFRQSVGQEAFGDSHGKPETPATTLALAIVKTEEFQMRSGKPYDCWMMEKSGPLYPLPPAW